MILDLFAGPGGWDEGLRDLGRTDVVGLDLDDAACRAAMAAGHLRIRADVTGLDLMCGACLLNNRDQEKRKLLSIYGAHDFVPSTRSALRERLHWCECTWPEDDERHHGVDKPCRTSWGEQLTPPYDELRAELSRQT